MSWFMQKWRIFICWHPSRVIWKIYKIFPEFIWFSFKLRAYCYCGNTYGSIGLASSHGLSCNMYCTGNSTQVCGGINANSIYMLGIYMGCFNDNGSVTKINDFEINSLNSTNMTTQMCFASCRSNNYKYAGLQSEWVS